MKAVKRELIKRNGTKCMCCGNDVGSIIQWHHIKPIAEGGKSNYENSSLVCPNCHAEINKLKYGTSAYNTYTKKILANKK
jgi:5-methylcytosine-specific restriction endonuclease McrA